MFYELKYIFLFGLTEYYEMVDQFVMIFNWCRSYELWHQL
jgi:hypothetical protein